MISYVLREHSDEGKGTFSVVLCTVVTQLPEVRMLDCTFLRNTTMA
jgi:hypothetical protein